MRVGGKVLQLELRVGRLLRRQPVPRAAGLPPVRLPGLHLGWDVRRRQDLLQRRLLNRRLLSRRAVPGRSGLQCILVRRLYQEHRLRLWKGLLQRHLQGRQLLHQRGLRAVRLYRGLLLGLRRQLRLRQRCDVLRRGVRRRRDLLQSSRLSGRADLQRQQVRQLYPGHRLRFWSQVLRGQLHQRELLCDRRLQAGERLQLEQILRHLCL